MNVKKAITLLLSIMMLCGCATDSTKDKTEESANQSAAELYKGLDAKETYQKACDYFDENITYYKEVYIVGVTEVGCVEGYNENGKKSMLAKFISNFGPTFTACKDERYYQEHLGSVFEYTKEQQKEEYDKRQSLFIKPLLESKEDNSSKTEFVDISREDKDGEIIVRVKYTYASTTFDYEDGKTKWLDNVYKIKETYIGKDGLIYKIVTNDCDENFNNAQVATTSNFLDFNKKKSFDYDKEISNFKKYENMSVEEFKNELGIS